LVEQVQVLQTENDNALDAKIAAAKANTTDHAVDNLIETKEASRQARMEAVTAKLDDWMGLFGRKAALAPAAASDGLDGAYKQLLRNLVGANIYLVLLQ